MKSSENEGAAIRMPDLEADGWRLECGEARNRESPDTFWLPNVESRSSLLPGDLAKLVFSISVDDADQSVGVERMWVLVRERTPFGYFGVLDNKPSSIAKNDEFWQGNEIPFEPRHVIDIERGDERTRKLAEFPPRKKWS